MVVFEDGEGESSGGVVPMSDEVAGGGGLEGLPWRLWCGMANC